MISLLDATLVGEAFAPTLPIFPGDRVLVLGVGNLLMGDEGVGVHVLRRLEGADRIPGVRLLDGGTGGAYLLGEFDGRKAIVLVDATRDGSAAGTLAYRYRKTFGVGDLPRGLSAHDFGLKDLIAAAALIGTLPELHLFTIAVEEVRPMCTELSPPVAAALSIVTELARTCARRLAVDLAGPS